MHVALVHNPDAGGGDLDHEELHSRITEAGHTFDSWSSADPEWRGAIRGGYDLIVAAGGDGTVHEVFLAGANGSTPMTILPVGTANNVARTLGFDTDEPTNVIAGWSRGAVVNYDLPTARVNGASKLMVEGVAGGLLARLLQQSDARHPNGPTNEELWTLFLELVD